MTNEDAIEKAIGRFGVYQSLILFLITLGRLPTEFQINMVVFLLPNTDYVCRDGETQNMTNHCPCYNPEFDQTTNVITSATSEWNLICDRKNLASLAQSIMQVGILVGSLFYGFVSDRYGRKIAVLLALFSEALFVMGSSFVPQFWMFLVFRFLIGTAVGGTMLCCYVILVELSGKSFRPYLVGLHEISFLSGYIILPIMAYFVREWRQLQLVTSVPWLLVIVYYWIIPESPRWLMTVGKKKEAINVLTRIARKNNKPVDDIEMIITKAMEELTAKNDQQKGSYMDLFKTSKMRVYIFVTSSIWMCCTLVFFGVNQYIGRLQGNLYLNVILSALTVAPALIVIVIGTLYLKRKVFVVSCFSLAAISLLSLMFMTRHNDTLSLVFAIIGHLGAYVSFVLVYLFTSEVFPTVIRNSAMGFSSMFGRVGGFVAPFVVNVGIEWVSILIFSVLAFTAAILCCFLPETSNITLLNSVNEAENFKKDKNDVRLQIVRL